MNPSMNSTISCELTIIWMIVLFFAMGWLVAWFYMKRIWLKMAFTVTLILISGKSLQFAFLSNSIGSGFWVKIANVNWPEALVAITFISLAFIYGLRKEKE